MKLFLCLIFTFNSLMVSSEVLDFKITGYERKLYKYKDVCKEMGHKHLLLVEASGALAIDCMGTKVAVKDFCGKTSESGPLLRGYVNLKMEEVVCEYGQKALLSIACDKEHKHFCKSPAQSCLSLKDAYAYRHEVSHHSLIEKDVDDVLNCYFSSPLEVQVVKTKGLPLAPFQETPVIDDDIFAKKEKDSPQEIRTTLPRLPKEYREIKE